MASSLKVNYLLNLVNTISGMVFPIITFPYASRILEADGIGLINFYNSIITYISLVTCLGIPVYATREIAKVKHNPELMSKKSAEILFLHISLTVIGYFIVAATCIFVPKIRENYLIYLILSASIIFTTMGCDWFFRGTENFKFITIRGLICRVLYIPLLFIFVRSKNDLMMYAFLTVMVTVGNNLFNFYKISQVLKLKELKEAAKYPTIHLKGVTKIFLLSATTSLYLQLNILLLGFLSTATNVGYYVAASRVTAIVAGVITALQTTLLPRGSALLAQDNSESFNNTMSKVQDFIICFTMPMSAGLIIMAPLVIKLFAGDTYLEAVPCLQILCFNMIFSIFNGFICMGVLLPQDKEKIATYATLGGGVVSLVLNFALIPFFAQDGAAVASVGAELIVGVVMIFLGYKFIPFKIAKFQYLKYLICTLLMFILCYVCWHLDSFEAYRLVVVPVVGITFYILSLNLIKDKFFLEVQHLALKKLHLVK